MTGFVDFKQGGRNRRVWVMVFPADAATERAEPFHPA
jgi:hypothetical protein